MGNGNIAVRQWLSDKERFKMDLQAIFNMLKYEKQKGELCKLIEIVCKKVQKNCSVQEIADMLEEDETVIQEIYDVVGECAPEFDVEKIYQKISGTK